MAGLPVNKSMPLLDGGGETATNAAPRVTAGSAARSGTGSAARGGKGSVAASTSGGGGTASPSNSASGKRALQRQSSGSTSGFRSRSRSRSRSLSSASIPRTPGRSPSRSLSRSRSPSPSLSPSRSRSRSRSRSPYSTSLSRSRSPSSARSRSPSRTPVAGASAGPRSRRRAAGSDDDGGSDDGDDSLVSSRSGRVGANAAARVRRERRRMRLAEGGLNDGEKPTRGRLRNPSKYTDKSMYTNLDRSPDVGSARRQTAEGMPREIRAVCTNRLGRVRVCKKLLTPMNFRKIYLRLDNKLPRNLVLALTVDVSEKRLSTLRADDVSSYYFHASKYLTNDINGTDEVLNSELAVKWLLNALQVLDRIHLCTGRKRVVEALEEKYGRDIDDPGFSLTTALHATIRYHAIRGRDEALAELKKVADTIKPTDIRIWGVDRGGLRQNRDLPKYKEEFVFYGEARSNEVRSLPLKERKAYVKNAGFVGNLRGGGGGDRGGGDAMSSDGDSDSDSDDYDEDYQRLDDITLQEARDGVNGVVNWNTVDAN